MLLNVSSSAAAGFTFEIMVVVGLRGGFVCVGGGGGVDLKKPLFS